MRKKRKIDFILHEDDVKMLVFRFRPRQSNCHSFDEIPPKTWNDVYKVYYSYSIFERWKDDNYADILFDCSCDECSVIDEVSARIKHIIDGRKTITVRHMGEEYVIELLNNEVVPFGVGVSWIINKCKNSDLYEIMLWNYNDTGYRFYINKDRLKKFGEYLNLCCEYMLAHGDPI